MDISVLNNVMGTSNKEVKNVIKPLYTEKISDDELKEIKTQLKENSMAIAMNSLNVQTTVEQTKSFEEQYAEFQAFLDEIGYEGKPIAELSQEEASSLVAEDGFFGINQTSERIANFVINGAGGDENLMRAGREGMLEGFKQAEEMWGGELPEISQETMDVALQKVDTAMADLGFSIIDAQV